MRMLAVLLAAHGYRTHVASDGREGLAAAVQCQPDLIIMDSGLPDTGGIDIIKNLRAVTQIPVIVLSGRSTESDKVMALDAGADDYIAKPLDEAEFLAGVRAALRRAHRAGTGSRVWIGTRIVDTASRTVTGPPGHVDLTPTEWKVLEVLVRKPGRLVSTAELLADVPARGHVPGSSYLPGHLMHLRQKLETDPTVLRHLLTEPSSGVRFRP